jgi:hypothetical protein
MDIKKILLVNLCIILYSTYFCYGQNPQTITYLLTPSSKIIGNKFTDINVWDYRSFWLDDRIKYGASFFRDNYPFVKYVQLMTATGGSSVRDLFIDPKNNIKKNDYNVSSLINACRNITKQGLKPYIITGNVPLKLSAKTVFGAFNVNVSPPNNYNEYYLYIYHIADTLVKCFGINEVKQWKWGVLTEYENGDWFKANNSNADSTKIAYFKLYDYTVAALQQAIGTPNLYVGAHSMTTIPGLWDETLFIKHCASGINYKTKKIGTQINFLTTSFYDPKPGQFATRTLNQCINILRNSAVQHGLKNLKYGVDEGRILNGPDDKPLTSRTVGFSYQAALDAKIFKDMITNNICWFSTWSLNSEGIWGGLPTVESNLSALGYKMRNDYYVNPSPAISLKNNAAIDGIGGYNPFTNTAHLMLYSISKNYLVDAPNSIIITLKNLNAVKGKSIVIKRYIIDNDHSNWWPQWMRDTQTNNITANSYKDSSSMYSIEIPWTLTNNTGRSIWRAKQQKYMNLSKLNYTTIQAKLVKNAINLNTIIKTNSVVFYEILNVQLK